MAGELGYVGGKTIFDDYVREVRPRFLVRRTFQRTIYRPGELVQCDLWEPRELIPVGHGQTRRGMGGDGGAVLVAGDRRRADLLQGGAGHSVGPGSVLEPDRGAAGEAGVGPGGQRSRAAGDRPLSSHRSAGSSGSGWVILDAGGSRRRRERSSARTGSCVRTSSRGRRFANPLDFQLQLDGWCDRVNRRVHRTIRAVPAERLIEERVRMRPLPPRLPDTDRRFVMRVPQQPYLRVDRNDYSIDPVFAGRRVEVARRPGAHHDRGVWTPASLRAGTDARSPVG